MTDRFVYYDVSIQEQCNEFYQQAVANKDANIPLNITVQQAMLRIDEAELTINTKHKYPIQKTTAELEAVQKSLDGIRRRYAEHIESELKDIPDAEFEHIEKIEAQLRKLEAEAEEHAQFQSQPNSETNGEENN